MEKTQARGTRLTTYGLRLAKRGGSMLMLRSIGFNWPFIRRR